MSEPVTKAVLVVSGGRGFAPAPPGFSALMPVPMRGLFPQVIKKGCSGIPPRIGRGP
jgi:hypothetical protein